MLEVFAHVVAAEGEHGEGVAADGSCLEVERGSGNLRTDDRTEEHTMVPVGSLVHERNGARAASTEEDGVYRHTLGIFPFGGDSRALLCRSGKAGIGMGRRSLFLVALVLNPLIAFPVHELAGCVITDLFPPDVSVFGKGTVGEDGVFLDGIHGALVRVLIGTGRNTEESRFRVDGIEPSVCSELHPGNVVTDGLNLPSGDGRNEHGKVGLSACGGEGAGNILYLAFGIGELEDEHVLGKPSFFMRNYGCNAERKTLFSEKGVSAVSRAIGPDGAFFGEVGDVLVFDISTGPLTVVAFAFGEGLSYRVQTGNDHRQYRERREPWCLRGS